MKLAWLLLVTQGILTTLAANLDVLCLDRAGTMVVSNAFTNGVVMVNRSPTITATGVPCRNFFTTGCVAQVQLDMSGASGFYRAAALDVSDARIGFSNLVASYSLLSTIAGNGGNGGAGVNKWQASFENGPAINALLSRPHIAMADRAGNIYIADKDAHGVRKVQLDGTIVTVAGTSISGNGPDTRTPGDQVALNQPNGLWVREDGTVYILDLGNSKIRKLETDGSLSTLATMPLISSGRGLWVNEDETLAYVCSGTSVKKWTPAGLTDFATGFSQLGNLAIDPAGNVVVTDRGANRVYRLDSNGAKTPIAGNGTTAGGGDGQPALSTGLAQVRAIWFLPTGACFLGTDSGSQVWYVDTAGIIHLFINGSLNNPHAGDGAYFYKPGELRVGPIRQITADYEGNLLIAENDAGYIRKVRFLRYQPGN